MKIRKATIKDLDALWEFEKIHRKLDLKQVGRKFESFFNYDFKKKGKKAYVNWIAENLSNKETLILVIEKKTKILGFAIGNIFSLYNSRKGFISELFVDKKFRSEGYGERLIKELLTWFKKNKLDYVNLEVLQNNPTAIKFYEKLKFKTLLSTMTLKL